MRSLVIVGPTASGKSDLAIALAKKYRTEIISADSRQVFQGMDIGTGKVEGQLDLSKSIEYEYDAISRSMHPFISEGIPHWCIDLVPPTVPFSAAYFQHTALMALRDISSRGLKPIVVGGTGLYIRALTEGLSFPRSTQEAHAEVLKMSYEEALAQLLKLQPDAADYIELKNPRRVFRGLELLLSGHTSLAVMRAHSKSECEFLTLGVELSPELLRERILKRLDARLHAGMCEEVQSLLNLGISAERLDGFGLEYRYVMRYLTGAMSYDAMHEKLYTEICRFAKRQRTWFKKYSSVVWMEPQQLLSEGSRFLNEEL